MDGRGELGRIESAVERDHLPPAGGRLVACDGRCRLRVSSWVLARTTVCEFLGYVVRWLATLCGLVRDARRTMGYARIFDRFGALFEVSR
jgi:hypothetical protein